MSTLAPPAGAGDRRIKDLFPGEAMHISHRVCGRRSGTCFLHVGAHADKSVSAYFTLDLECINRHLSRVLANILHCRRSHCFQFNVGTRADSAP